MTIKKLGLSALAASLLTTGAFAATLQTGAGLESISEELLTVKAVDINVSNPIRFQCNMSETKVSTANAAGVQLTIPGLNTMGSGDFAVYRLNQKDGNVTEKVAVFNGSMVSSKYMAIFDGISTAAISEDAYYVIADNNLNTADVPVLTNTLTVSVPKGSKEVQATVQVVSSDGVSPLDEGTGKIAETKKQFGLIVVEEADAMIDAAAGFFAFTNSATTDAIKYKIVNNYAAIDHKAENADITTVLSFDQNLTDLFTITSTGTAASVSFEPADFNVTSVDSSDVNVSYTTLFTKKSSTEGKMDVTNFTLAGSVTFDGMTAGTSLELATDLDAGKWDIFGYKAQIPNAAGLSTHDTVLKFTNRSAIPANIYITLIDPTGTKVTVDSENDGISNLAVDKTGTYKLVDLVAIASAKDATFNGTGSVSVEVVVPTTPSQVYGMASFKNTALGQFKDLPVYNNSDMDY